MEVILNGVAVPLAPEPSSFVLFGVILTLLGGYYFRRRRLARLEA